MRLQDILDPSVRKFVTSAKRKQNSGRNVVHPVQTVERDYNVINKHIIFNMDLCPDVFDRFLGVDTSDYLEYKNIKRKASGYLSY